MSFTKEKIVPIYMILNGLSSMVPNILIISFALTLFESDKSGVSAAYLEPALLLGIGCAGLFGGFFIKHFSYYTIGVSALFLASFTLGCFLCYGEVSMHGCTITLWMLACIMSVEHSNGIAFINSQIVAQDRPFFFSAFQIFLQCFNVLAPIGAKNLLASFGLKSILVLCTSIYLLRIIPWQLSLSMNLGAKIIEKEASAFSGFKEIMDNVGLLRMTIFRIINHIPNVVYMVSLPILVAKIAHGNSQVNAQLYSYSLSFMNIGFILSGIYGSWLLKRNPTLITLFFTLSPMLIGVAVVAAFYVKIPIYLTATALVYGMGLYFFKTSNCVIGQALTKKNKLAHVILAGDAIVKACAYCVGMFVPIGITFSPFFGVLPPLLSVVACSLFSLKMARPIIKIYMHSLSHKDDTTV